MVDLIDTAYLNNEDYLTFFDTNLKIKNNEIFKASDTMVDSLTQLIARKRDKNIN